MVLRGSAGERAEQLRGPKFGSQHAPLAVPEALTPSPGLCWDLHTHAQPLLPRIHKIKKKKKLKKREKEEFKGQKKRRGKVDQMTKESRESHSKVSHVALGGAQ